MSVAEPTPPPNEEAGAAETAGPAERNLACWFAPEYLVVFGTLQQPPGDSSGVLIAGEQSLQASIRCMPVTSLDDAGVVRETSLLVVTTEDSAAAREHELVLLENSLEQVAPAHLFVTDLAPMIIALPDLPPKTREAMYQFISSAIPSYDISQRDTALSMRLAMMWGNLRNRLPVASDEPLAPRACVVESLLKIDEKAFWIHGWANDFEAPIWRLTAVSPEGERVELLDRCLRYLRPDVVPSTVDEQRKLGFICFFELERPSYVPAGWILRVENAAGLQSEAPIPAPTRGTSTVRDAIMTSIPVEVLPNERFMVDHVSPAIGRLHEQTKSRSRIASVTDYGELEGDPEVSIVIPLYQQVNFVEHQLAQFVSDPYVQSNELIYVLDSPEMLRYVQFTARELFRLYGVPFRIVEMERSVGFACASNAGASVANGRLLLMMNSDILPDRPGWLATMQEFYDSTPNIGALGPKLLYEDDSIQHAGLYFQHPGDAALLGSWANWHYFKGMPRNLPAANVARPVPGVTGACLMIAKNVYEQAGRFPEVYIQGDHEDSELCLRLIAEGYENWYLPKVELYHLESRSYNMGLRLMLALYNRWLHNKRMGGFIEEIMLSFELPEREGPPQYREVGQTHRDPRTRQHQS